MLHRHYPTRIMVGAALVIGGLAGLRAPGQRRRIIEAMKTSRAAARRYLPGSPFNAPAARRPVETFAVHDQVTHDKYGLGVILGVEEDVAVLVDFRPQQLRIPVPCAKLTKL
jgi:hypothetical protein